MRSQIALLQTISHVAGDTRPDSRPVAFPATTRAMRWRADDLTIPPIPADAEVPKLPENVATDWL